MLATLDSRMVLTSRIFTVDFLESDRVAEGVEGAEGTERAPALLQTRRERCVYSAALSAASLVASLSPLAGAFEALATNWKTPDFS